MHTFHQPIYMCFNQFIDKLFQVMFEPLIWIITNNSHTNQMNRDIGQYKIFN